MKKLDLRSPEIRLRDALGNHNFQIFTLLKRYGDGFVAVPHPRSDRDQTDVLVARKRVKDGIVTLQRLETPGATKKTITELRDWSNHAFVVRSGAFNHQKRVRGFRWEDLVPKEEVTAHEALWGTRITDHRLTHSRTRPRHAAS